MTNPITQLYKEGQEKFECLDMSDQESKGCTVSLFEWMNNENMDIIQSHHKHATLKLLRAVKEGVGDNDEDAYNPEEGREALIARGINTAKSEMRQLLDEAIMEIENL